VVERLPDLACKVLAFVEKAWFGGLRVKPKVYQLEEFDLELMARLTQLERIAFGEGGMNQWMLAPHVRYGRVFCLEYADEIIGVMEFMSCCKEPDTCYLAGISVDPKYQNRGFGRFFLDEALSRVKEDGFTRVILTVAPKNDRAIHLYRSFGFEEGELLVDVYGPGEDWMEMVKEA
jgi:ribosomal-protein-alanine N-acetyltransferase